MYRLLIVDDERDVADGLYDRFRNLECLELDVYKAYSAMEALEVLNGRKIDIVLTDMRMPGMNGLELMENVRRRWPECPVIFLTGYSEFDTMYAASRQGNVEYLLKTESPEAIVEAVTAAARRLDERGSLDKLTRRANTQMEAWLPVMRRACLRALLDGEGGDETESKAQFESLGIGLDAGKPVLLLAARRSGQGMTAIERSRQEMLIEAACEGCFSAQVRWAIAAAGMGVLFWLLQPAPDGPGWEQLRTQARGSAEAIQTACAEALGLSLSFVVDGGPIVWSGLPGRCDALRQLLRMHEGQSQQIILDGGAVPRSGAKYRAVFRKVRMLEECLEDGRRAEFDRLLDEIASVVGEDASSFFRALAREAAPSPQAGPTSAAAVVSKVNGYIAAHLDEDLSLVRLADMVYFNPSYLSRVFKQVTGQNVIERINSARVARARELLSASRMKIKDIAQRVGYDSPSYFTQFFKRETGMSPQEYRDMSHRDEVESV